MESVPVVNTVITLPHVIVESIPLHVNAGNINLAIYMHLLEFLRRPKFLQHPELQFTVAKYRRVMLNIMELEKETASRLALLSPLEGKRRQGVTQIFSPRSCQWSGHNTGPVLCGSTETEVTSADAAFPAGFSRCLWQLELFHLPTFWVHPRKKQTGELEMLVGV